MGALSGEESPKEKEDRLNNREERLGKQHERLKEGGSVHGSSHGLPGFRSGSSPSRLGGSHPNTESFIGEHKVMIMVAAGVAVLVYVLWNMHSNPSPANALTGGSATPGQGSAAGPNVGTTNDAGTTYGIQQLTNQLGTIQTALENQLNQITGSAPLPAAGAGNGPVNLLAVAQPDATNVAQNYIPATDTSPALAIQSTVDAFGNTLTPQQQSQSYADSLAAATNANIPSALSIVNANLAQQQSAYAAAAQKQTELQQSIQASAISAYNQNQADLGQQGNAQILAARQAANPGYTVSPPVWNPATGTYIYNNY